MTSSPDELSKSIDEFLGELSHDSDLEDMSETLESLSTTVSGGDSSYEEDSFVVKSPNFHPDGVSFPTTPQYDEDEASDESLVLIEHSPPFYENEVFSISLKSVIGADGLLKKKIRDAKRKRIFLDLTKDDEEPGAARCRKAPRREVIIINDD